MTTWAELSGSEKTMYEQTVNSFTIHNAGDVDIDPRESPLVITFTGPSENLAIENRTTGDRWEYTGTTGAADVIKLDGIRATKNGLTIFRDTNRKVITLQQGANDIEVTGNTGDFTITFDFRFHYL